MERLTIQEKHNSNYVLLEFEGVINYYTFSDFKIKVFFFVHDINVVIDLSAVTLIDSSGMSVILGGCIAAEMSGNKLYIMQPSKQALRAIEATGFADTIPIIFSVTEVI